MINKKKGKGPLLMILLYFIPSKEFSLVFQKSYLDFIIEI